jgi:hypothetical protein
MGREGSRRARQSTSDEPNVQREKWPAEDCCHRLVFPNSRGLAVDKLHDAAHRAFVSGFPAEFGGL